MSRLSREKKREQKQAAHAATPAAPIDVRVPGAGADPGAGPGAGTRGASDGASVGGVPVFATPGEEIQRAVLNRLHHIALAAGHPVLATVHDERIGYVVPLQVDPDGSSRFTAEPVRTAPPAAQAGTEPSTPAPGPMPPAPAPGPMPPAPEQQHPQSDDRATHILRPVPDSGTVAPPTGRFGPPPPMDAQPLPVSDTGAAPPKRRPVPEPLSEAALLTADPDPMPVPARGFDAVAEAVLGDAPGGAPGDSTAPVLLAEPIARISEAVREGRIDAAAELAEQTIAQAAGTLGPEHPEVLRLGELTAYVAYLAGDPVRAFRLSLDLAGAHLRAGDAEAAYGNVRSAATAWRAVRDPARGLELGRELIGLWTDLAAGGGPAAEEIERLESARARMGRLTERARTR
ncbi:tetratricopeptide repeat protein [Streptomyces sp. NPDC019990]|uniref:tetratricopeptide repeat protein n=1 Tax=Streptomyces sp. NPDC019990 TaxID=3154693 RepID=UPI0033D39B1B